ncbi:hypothetical protein JK359_10150 [Streptomyces actinomycinicus]|uniref:Secreted protein n=1 Tax=Streptomyces actinomycinicus TaxID=1695166 RepID=A0A937EGG7_9ACTN|nr:hypothetical protein [Streptomyces actinomycinicus]MBL1082341.1 hypothetical protein [Streptomyces actinomycinicus]
MHLTRMTASVGIAGAAALCLALPAQVSADTGPPVNGHCGTDQASGLGVSAGKNVPCATALQVAAAYTGGRPGTADAPVPVRAAGSVWKCHEEQGDPNPYQRCVDTQDDTRLVMLSS